MLKVFSFAVPADKYYAYVLHNWNQAVGPALTYPWGFHPTPRCTHSNMHPIRIPPVGHRAMYVLLSIKSQGPIQYEHIVQQRDLVAIPNLCLYTTYSLSCAFVT